MKKITRIEKRFGGIFSASSPKSTQKSVDQSVSQLIQRGYRILEKSTEKIIHENKVKIKVIVSCIYVGKRKAKNYQSI